MTPAGASDSDAALTMRAAKGDHAAFNVFVQRHQEALYRFIRRYVGDADEAYDLLQETFVSAWQALGRYDPARPAPTWLRRIALNKCRDWGRRRTVRRFFYGAMDIDTAHPAALVSAGDDTDDPALRRLDRALASLPAQLKEPLLLTAFEGLSHRDAGQVLGISTKAVETRIYRARKLLAEAMNVDTAADGDDN
jgi:RNA polymerase sigma-70 factor (ECF subfamily)